MAEMAEINYLQTLRPMFPNRSEEEMREIIQFVLEDNRGDSFNGNIENMVNMLMEDGARGPIPNNANSDPITTETVYGEPYQQNYSFNDNLYKNLMQFFQDIDPNYLLRYCREKPPGYDFYEAIEDLSTNGYEKIKVNAVTVWEQLKAALPDADPDYLLKESERLVTLTEGDIHNFLEDAIINKGYPTMQDYLERMRLQETISSYTDCFSIETFLRTFPDPDETFSKIEKQQVFDENPNSDDVEFARTFLYNKYCYVRKHSIDMLFKRKMKNLYELCEELDKLPKQFRIQRAVEPLGPTNNIPLLQLTAYLKHRKQIKNFFKMKDEDYRKKKEEAIKYGLLQTCQCCFFDELIPEECFFCRKGCVFCADCVRRGTETVIGKGNLKFPCYNICEGEFTLETVQMILPEKTFKQLVHKIATEEIIKANIEGLEICPFCGLAVLISSKSDRVIKCTNDDCMKESCRICRYPSHLPQRCSEIEYDEDVKRRTYIEDKMTEALTRTCLNCKKKFIKSTGCNKMTCICGYSMCYLCCKPVTDYSHFGNGGCSLHTNDKEVILERILENADKAKATLGNVEIKYDPTENIREFYQ